MFNFAELTHAVVDYASNIVHKAAAQADCGEMCPHNFVSSHQPAVSLNTRELTGPALA